MIDVLHQLVQLAVWISAADAAEISQIGAVLPDREAAVTKVGFGQLPDCFFGAADPMPGQLAAGRRIDRIAYFLGGGCGIDVDLLLQTDLLYRFFHDKPDHLAASNIPVANKEDFHHWQYTP